VGAGKRRRREKLVIIETLIAELGKAELLRADTESGRGKNLLSWGEASTPFLRACCVP
jgi:hypothetical protein